MGRGIAYSYEHFMLIREDAFLLYPSMWDEENGVYVCYGEPGYDELEEADRALGNIDFPEEDEHSREQFYLEVCEVLNCYYLTGRDQKWPEREVRIIGDNDRFELGVDYGGGTPCIFARPKTYTPGNNPYSGDVKEYRIDREVKRAFNKLCRTRPSMFSVSSSGYTSMPISQYSPLKVRAQKKNTNRVSI